MWPWWVRCVDKFYLCLNMPLAILKAKSRRNGAKSWKSWKDILKQTRSHLEKSLLCLRLKMHQKWLHSSLMLPPKVKWRHFGQCHNDLPNLLPLNKAVPIIPSTTIKLSKTGVPQAYYSDRQGSEGQSIYKCYLKHPGTETTCSYWSAQLAAMTTHIRQKHLKICVKCHLCSKRSYSTTTIVKHLKLIHHDQQNEWFNPTPLLEGDKIEVTDAVLAANLQEVENIKADPDAKEQDD